LSISSIFFHFWEEFPNGEGEEQEQKVLDSTNRCFFEEESYYSNSIKVAVKRENIGFWDDDDEKMPTSLNLNLNYEQVLDAWSNRGSPWADGDGDGYSLSMPSNGYYVSAIFITFISLISRSFFFIYAYIDN
jgi:hypothetical protein